MENHADKVRQRAYELWEEADRPEGGAEDFWHRAEREVKAAQAPEPGIGEEASARHFARDVDTASTEGSRSVAKPTERS